MCSPRRMFKSSYYFEEFPILKYRNVGFHIISTLSNRPHFYVGVWELLETLQMTLCRIPRKVMVSVLLYFLSITASIFSANICYTPWGLLILDYCTIVPSYICELHIRTPTVRTTTDYSVQSASKYRWHAVKKFYLLKLLCKFIHTHSRYI
jgi:hypothetical protein